MQRVLRILFLMLLTTTALRAQPPELKHTVKGKAPRGFYVTQLLKTDGTKLLTGYLVILNERGEIIWYRRHDQGLEFKPLPGGNFSLFRDGKYRILDSRFREIDSIGCSESYKTDPHEFRVLKNGNYLLLGTETYPMDLSRYAMFLGNKQPGSRAGSCTSYLIQEFDTNHQLVFEWHANKDYRITDVDEFYMNDTLRLDWMHANSVDRDESGNYWISMRNTNDIAIVDGKSGELLHRLKGDFKGQHEARPLAGKRFTLFDNGHSDPLRRKPSRACICSYRSDGTLQTLCEIRHNPPVFSDRGGSMQGIDSNHFLVCWGRVACPLAFGVYNRKGDELFRIGFDDSLAAYRCTYVPELNIPFTRPVVDLVRENGQLFLAVNKAYSAYHWSDGSKTRWIAIQPGKSYQVFVPAGEQGFIGSVPFVWKGDPKSNPKQKAVRRK